MSDSSENLRHRIDGAVDLQTVVRTMKALSASGISQYEHAVAVLDAYYHTIELGLIACLRQPELRLPADHLSPQNNQLTGVIVFGSDQGLVGQFNDALAQFVSHALTDLPGEKQIWAVGERMRDRLEDAELPLAGLFNVPASVNAITTLTGQLLLTTEAAYEHKKITQWYLFHNRPDVKANTYQPVSQRLLPLDAQWQQQLLAQPWQTNNLPETLGPGQQTLSALIREYLFVSLYRACAESLASENASRLAAMQRAEKNIGEMLDDLTHTYHQLRQENIDAELFDVVSGLEEI